MTRPVATVPRLALTVDELASALGVSRDWLEQHGVLQEIRVVRRGRRILVPITEVERWLERNAARALEGARW